MNRQWQTWFGKRARLSRKRGFSPRLEALEERVVPTTFFHVFDGPSGGSQPRQIAVADFNHDGKIDLAIANHWGGSVSILLGNGDGTFQATRTVATGFSPTISVFAGDFNGDGNPDLAVADMNFGFPSIPGKLLILLGNGDGTFSRFAEYASGHGYFLTAADVNGDGNLDLLVPDREDFNKGAVEVWLGNGDGTFSHSSNVGDFSPDTVAVADFNGDGKPDLAMSCDGYSVDSGIHIALGNGDGTFSVPAALDPWTLESGMIVGDFNGDGKPDLAVRSNGSGGPAGLPCPVTVLLGNGDGSFRRLAATAAGRDFGQGMIVAGDVNGDGSLDLIAANQAGYSVSLLLGNGDGSFQPQQTYATDGDPIAVALGDFDGDGKLDLAVGSRSRNYPNTDGIVSVFTQKNPLHTDLLVTGPASAAGRT